MNKLRIRITRVDDTAKKGRFYRIDKEETIFLHEMNEDSFFSLLVAIGEVDSYAKEVRASAGEITGKKALEDPSP